MWLRAQPDSANQTILETLTDGAAVTVTGAEVNDGQQDWLPVQVNVTYGSTGWVEATSLSECDTPVVVNCTPRSDWTITYAVQPGNTLAQIAQAAGISLNELAEANCIADVNRIISGQQLRVPRTVVLPTATPGASPTPAPSATATVDNGPKISTGTWTFVFTTQYVDCQTAAPPPAEVTRTDAYVDVSPDGQSLTWVVSSPGVQMQRTGTNTFYGTNPNIPGYTWTLTVTGTNQGNMYVTVPCDQYTSA
ncbi:MAG: LysM peptidoglycan-binding domain-containing protein [Anaerolineae bacterium]